MQRNFISFGSLSTDLESHSNLKGSNQSRKFMNVSEVSSMLRHSLRNDSSRESTLQNQSLLSIASLKSIPAQNYSNDSKEFLLASLSSSSLSTSKTNGFPIETFPNSIEMKTNEIAMLQQSIGESIAFNNRTRKSSQISRFVFRQSAK